MNQAYLDIWLDTIKAYQHMPTHIRNYGSVELYVFPIKSHEAHELTQCIKDLYREFADTDLELTSIEPQPQGLGVRIGLEGWDSFDNRFEVAFNTRSGAVLIKSHVFTFYAPHHDTVKRELIYNVRSSLYDILERCLLNLESFYRFHHVEESYDALRNVITAFGEAVPFCLPLEDWADSVREKATKTGITVDEAKEGLLAFAAVGFSVSDITINDAVDDDGEALRDEPQSTRGP